MSDDITEELDSPNQSSEEDVNTEPIEETDAQPETEDGQPEYTEREQELYARLKKAQGFTQNADGAWIKPQAKPKPKQTAQPASSGLGQLSPVQLARDSKAIYDLVDEDVDYVATYADKFGVTLSEARKNKDVQAVLSVRAEERRTAEATNTGTARRGTSRLSDEALLEKASSGDFPSDSESMMRIARARLAKLKS